MEKEFIPYEEALALKELGFDDKCFGAYNKKCKLAITTSDYWDNSSLYRLNDYFGKNTYRCLAPLYQQAFRWFRDKYNLLFYIKKGCNPSNYYLVINEESHKYNPQMWFDTYEEAELACLRKLIEIAKNED